MRAAAVFRALGPIDARSVFRDSLLAWMVAMPLAVGLLLRLATPAVGAWLARDFAFDLSAYTTLLMSYFVVGQAPAIVGFVIGFLLIEERDDGTLTALLVTPLSETAYLRWRIGVPLLACTAVTVAAFEIAGLVPLAWPWLLAVCALAALEAPMLALFLAVFAADKVQGFALLKGVGGLLLAPAAAWFLPLPWQWAAGVVPSYWPMKAFWLVVEGSPGAGAVLAAGLVFHLALLALLLRRFRRVVR